MKSKKLSCRRFSVFACFILFTSVLTACGGGGGGGSSSVAPSSVSVSGAAAKGTLINSNVTVFTLNDDGSRRGTAAIIATTTDANGNFSLTLDPNQFVTLVVTAGSYIDESTLATINLAQGEELEAYAQIPSNGQISINITPLTSLAAAQAREHVLNDGQALADAINNANAEISSIFDVGNVLSTALLSPTSLGSASQQEINYALVLAGISQLDADDAGQTAFEIVKAMAIDIADDGFWGNASNETPQKLLAAKDTFLGNNAGTIFENVSAQVTSNLGQAVLDVAAAGNTVNDAPVAIADSGTVAEGGNVTIDLAGNDTDPDSMLDVTSIVVASAPANGAVVVNADGTVTYTHDGGETASDSFTYTINDDAGARSSAATVTVTVTPVNDTPVANDDSATVGEGNTFSVNLVGNDVDPENDFDLASINIASGAANGTLTINNDGSVDYTHDGSEAASDSFTYTIDDNDGARSNIATVSITVTLGNDSPAAFPDSATVDEGGSANINLAGNDADAEGALDAASIVIFTAPVNGTVDSINADGTVDYTHDGGETTSDSFSYTISDVLGATSNTATVSLTVTPINDVPIANDDASTVNEGATINIDLGANDVDAEGVDGKPDLTSINIVSGPANGTIDNINADGSVDYTHNGSETASDSFTYTINDASGVTSNTATVTLTVILGNDAPVASDDSASFNRGGVSISIDLAANDSDADDGLNLASIFIVSGPSNGTIDSINIDGSVSYRHDGSSTLSDSFTYTISDVSGVQSNTATVNLAVLEGFNEALYATPTASSYTTLARQSEASDGVTGDAGNGWVAGNNGPNPAGPHTLTLTFDSPKSIYRVTLSDLVDLTNQVTSATLGFSNGDQITVATALPNDGTAQEFVFAPKLVTSVTVTLNTANGAFGLSEFSAFAGLDPGQTIQKVDLLKDSAAMAANWTTVDDCDKGVSAWGVTNGEFQQTGTCRGFDPMEGVELGTYQLLTDGFLVTDMDLRLRLKSTDTSNGDPDANVWVNGAIGVLFAHRDPGSTNDYYRLDISQAEGHIKLSKKVGGVYSELNTSPQSFTPDAWFNVRIVRQNGVIVVYKNEVKVMAVEDNENALNNNDYRVALFCARNESCSFEKLIVLSPPTLPVVGVNIVDGPGHASGEYHVDTAGSLDLVAVVTDDTDVTEVEFVIDEGQGGEISFTDSDGAPYMANFNLLAEGNHNVRTYLRDASGRLGNAGAVEELPQVGVSGIYLVGIGDSITSGLRDAVLGNATYTNDNISTDGRNTGGGYQSILNNLLTDANATPVTVLNEGNAGETSAEGSDRIDAILARTPAAQGYLMIYGANDSSNSVLTPSGTGLSCDDIVAFATCDSGYLGSFKHNVQIIINAVNAAGKTMILGKAPPHLAIASRNTTIAEYNVVIDELMIANGFIGYAAPDFQAYFTANPGEMTVDGLHPNGIGYSSMADGWCKTLNGRALPVKGVISCTEAGSFPN